MSAPGTGSPGSFAPAAKSGLATVLGTAAITAGDDTLAATGATIVHGTGAATLDSDTVSAAGLVSAADDPGVLAVTLASDTLVATGTVSIVGTAAASEADDTLVATGVCITALAVEAPTSNRLATYGRRVPLTEQPAPRQVEVGAMRMRGSECCDCVRMTAKRGTIARVPEGGSLRREVREAFEAEERLIRDYFEALGFEIVD